MSTIQTGIQSNLYKPYLQFTCGPRREIFLDYLCVLCPEYHCYCQPLDLPEWCSFRGQLLQQPSMVSHLSQASRIPPCETTASHSRTIFWFTQELWNGEKLQWLKVTETLCWLVLFQQIYYNVIALLACWLNSHAIHLFFNLNKGVATESVHDLLNRF